MDKTELCIYENLKRVYICHPYRNDPVNNVKKVEKIVTDIGLASARSVESGDPWKPKFTTSAITSKFVQCDDKSVGTRSENWNNFIVPVSPMLAFPMGMSEIGGNPITDQQGMAFCLSLLFSCHELWVYDKTPTDGMVIEIEASSRWGLPVVWKV